jgi:hypothetical protein
MTWRPLAAIPEPIDLALRNAVRARVSALDTSSGVSRGDGDRLIVDMRDGRSMHVMLAAGQPRPVSFGPREAVRYDLEGRAILDTEGFGVAGYAIIDLKTRAFFDVGCRILWRDHVGDRARP